MTIRNKIVLLSASSYNAVRKELASDDNVLIVEVDGAKCSCLSEYLHTISNAFSFPTQPSGLDGYNDWICDLTWLDSDLKIAIIIEHFSKFLRDDLNAKKCVLEDFKNVILPWWETDVINHMIDGKPRLFSVYLID